MGDKEQETLLARILDKASFAPSKSHNILDGDNLLSRCRGHSHRHCFLLQEMRPPIADNPGKYEGTEEDSQRTLCQGLPN